MCVEREKGERGDGIETLLKALKEHWKRKYH